MVIPTILLAAGASTRMGHPKQLIPVDGIPLIRKMAKIALESTCNEVFVVLGANHQKIEPVIKDLPVNIVNNPDWEKGMGASIRAGIRAIPPISRGVLLMVCDQPFITTELLDKIIHTFQTTRCKIVATHYGKAFGTPALFDMELFPWLKSLEDSKGAKSLIPMFIEKVGWIKFRKAEIDLDTPEDVDRWISSNPD